MMAPARFLFDTDFSAPEIRVEEEPAVEETDAAPVAEHLRLLVEAESRGHRRGVAEGRAEASATAARRLADEAGRLASAAQGILAALDADRQRIEKEAAALALTVAKKLASHLIERQPASEIVALIESCLGPLRQAPHIVIRVDERDADRIKSEADRIAHERGFMGRLVVLGEPDLARGDCRIEWADGGIVRDRGALESEIDGIITRYFNTGEIATAGGGVAEGTDITGPDLAEEPET